MIIKKPHHKQSRSRNPKARTVDILLSASTCRCLRNQDNHWEGNSVYTASSSLSIRHNAFFSLQHWLRVSLTLYITQAKAFSLSPTSPTNQVDIELKKESEKRWNKRALYFHACSRVESCQCAHFLPRKIHQVSRGGGDWSVQHPLDTLEKGVMRVTEAFQPQQIANIVHIKA